MVVVHEVKLAVLAVAVVVNHGHADGPVGFGFILPMNPQLHLLVYHPARLALCL